MIEDAVHHFATDLSYFIDTHAHLDYPAFAEDFSDVLDRAAEAGVTRIVTVGTGIESSHRAVALAERYKAISAVIGIHPNHVMEEPPEAFETLTSLADNPCVVALGETGLDYFRLPDEGLQENIERQKQLFRAHLILATQRGLNVVVHQREAWDDTLALMSEFPQVCAVFHCFVGTIEQAQTLISRGHCVSFTGIATFKNAPVVKASIAALPPSTFMLETDCPYLAPDPHRGLRCEPAHIPHIARAIATLRQTTPEMIARETSELASIFFSRK